MKTGQVNNVIRIPCKGKNGFFRIWLQFLAPFHNMANREMDVAAAFLERRYKLSKVISDDDLLDETIINKEGKRKVRESLDMSIHHFQLIMQKLKQARFLIDGKINTKFIPKNIDEDENGFKLMLYFDFQ